jgi:hypothetical protein
MEKCDRSHPGPVWVRADDPLAVYGVECGHTDGSQEAPSVAIVERFRDDQDFEHQHRVLAIRKLWRWDADRLVERYEGFFHSFPVRVRPH